jgi:hypothetical protein
MSTLREAAQQALEALENCASEHGHRCGRCDSEVDEGGRVVTALRDALAQEEREPVAWLKTMYSGTRPMLEVDHLRKDTSTPVYTHPPRREWQSLSEEEIDRWTPEIHLVIRAIETKLKEKNHG